jgi:hypothetical protein
MSEEICSGLRPSYGQYRPLFNLMLHWLLHWEQAEEHLLQTTWQVISFET